MSITIGLPSAPAPIRSSSINLLAQASGPVGPARRLPDDAVKVLRDIFGPQIGRLPADRLSVWDGVQQEATRDQQNKKNGTIFHDGKVWRGVVFDAMIEKEGRAFPNPPKFKTAIHLQEGLHALAAPHVTREENEVLGEYASIKYYPDYVLYPMKHILNFVNKLPIKGYEHIYHYSLHSLGVVSDRYGLGFIGSPVEKGRQLMAEFIRSGADRHEKMTFDFLRNFAKKNFSLVPPEQFVDDIRKAFLSTFSAATRQIIGEPGKLKLR